MKGKSYTFFIASSASGGMRRVRVPFYVVHLLTALVVVGGITGGGHEFLFADALEGGEL